MHAYNHDFNEFFKNAVEITCDQWKYEVPGYDYYMEVYRRFPYGLQTMIAEGLKSRIIKNSGLTKRGSAAFNLNGNSNGKGPYAWFEKDSIKNQPRPCWEYYVQAGEYVRLVKGLNNDFRIHFEDNLMDIAIYKGDRLLVCCEMKNEPSQAASLINQIKRYEDTVDLPVYDRGNDGLRKAKYLKMMKPDFFYVVSIGRRYEFRVEHNQSETFRLIEDMIPF